MAREQTKVGPKWRQSRNEGIPKSPKVDPESTKVGPKLTEIRPKSPVIPKSTQNASQNPIKNAISF